MSKVTGYEKLAHAIILQAVKDYRMALEDIKAEPDDTAALEAKSEIEEFFCSDWFNVLTRTSGRRIMHELQREAA